MVEMAKAMSGRVDSAAQLSTPTASQYGTSCMATNLALLLGDCSEESRTEVSMGVERGLRLSKW